MDILEYGFFFVIAILGALFKTRDNNTRLIPFIAFIVDAVWLAILYDEHVGVTFTSLGISYIIPMTETVTGKNLPVAPMLAFLCIIIDGWTAITK